MKNFEHNVQKKIHDTSARKKTYLDIPNISFRNFSDEVGSQGDTLIFNFTKSETAINISKFMENKGLGTKILPEAYKWHFASEWDHIKKLKKII